MKSTDFLQQDLRIVDVRINPEMDGAFADAWITVDIENNTGIDAQVMTSIVVALGENREKIEIAEWIPVDGGTVEAVVRIEQPQFWWPNGFGEQTLYTCMVGILYEDEVQDAVERKFAVREIRYAGRDGQSFILIVNGEEVFCKGVNWTSADSIISSATPDRCRELVQLARDANLNVICVRGDTPHDSPELHRACDEMGIVVWSEGDSYGEGWINIDQTDDAELIKTQTESCRRDKWDISGFILSALADSRPNANWSLVDCEMRPTMSYYYAKRACASVLLSFKKLDNKVRLYVTTDDRLSGIDGKLQIGVYTFGTNTLEVTEVPVNLPPNSSDCFWESPSLSDMMLEPSRQCLVALLDTKNQAVAKGVYFHLPFAEMDFPQPKLLIERQQLEDNQFAISVSATDYARNVVLCDLPARARPSDNYFDLLPGEVCNIMIDNITPEDAKKITIDVLRI